MQKKENLGTFTVPGIIRLLHFAKVLCDFAASINLMPFSIYKNLGLVSPKPTSM